MKPNLGVGKISSIDQTELVETEGGKISGLKIRLVSLWSRQTGLKWIELTKILIF